MKRVGVFLAIAASLVLAGCGAKSIEGSVETVVDEAQELSTDAEVEAKVTGDTADYGDEYGSYLAGRPQPGDSATVVLQSDDEGTYLVFCAFDSITEEEIDKIDSSGRLTVSGTIDGEGVSSESVFLLDCEIE